MLPILTLFPYHNACLKGQHLEVLYQKISIMVLVCKQNLLLQKCKFGHMKASMKHHSSFVVNGMICNNAKHRVKEIVHFWFLVKRKFTQCPVSRSLEHSSRFKGFCVQITVKAGSCQREFANLNANYETVKQDVNTFAQELSTTKNSNKQDGKGSKVQKEVEAGNPSSELRLKVSVPWPAWMCSKSLYIKERIVW